MRGWGPFPGDVPDPNRSGLFEYLNAGKRGTIIDLENDASVASRLIADAHVLVEALPPGTLDRWGLDVHALEALSPGLVVVRISDFGQHGPLRDRVATPLTMQAASGWINRRDPDRPPVQAGARISEYVAGAYAALGALTALRTRSARTNGAIEVDVSVLESLLSTLPYPMLMAERMRKLGLPADTRVGADDGHRPRGRRVDRNQLSDGPALARCVRDARSAGVRRAPGRNHAGRSRARGVLRQGRTVALRAHASPRSWN